jgi:hypothetical protein
MTLNNGGVILPGAGGAMADTDLHGVSLLWNGGGTITLELGANSGDEINLNAALTKGSAGTFTIDLENDGIASLTGYTLLTFGSTTFSLANFTVDWPAGFSGTLVESGNSLSITDLAPVTDELPAHDEAVVSGPVLTSDSGDSAGNSLGQTSNLIATPEPGGGAVRMRRARRMLNGTGLRCGAYADRSGRRELSNY